MTAIAQPTPIPPIPASAPAPRISTNPIEAKVFEQLNLTPDQKQKIQSLDEKYQSQMSQLMQSNRQLFREYQQMMESDTATTEQIREKHRQTQAISQQVSNLSFERALAVRDILTPDQRKQRAATLRDPAKMQAIFRQIGLEGMQRRPPLSPQPKSLK